MNYLIPLIQIVDIDGKPIVGGTITTYNHGTSVKSDTFMDFQGHLNTNPIVLDSLGTCTIITPEEYYYDLVVKDKDGLLLFSIENVCSNGSSGGEIINKEVIVDSGKGINVVSTPMLDGSIVYKVSIDDEILGHIEEIDNSIESIQSRVTTIENDIDEIQADIVELEQGKQDKLVSGVNIKTLNGISLLGYGNIDVQGGLGETLWVRPSWEQTSIIPQDFDWNIKGSCIKLQSQLGASGTALDLKYDSIYSYYYQATVPFITDYPTSQDGKLYCLQRNGYDNKYKMVEFAGGDSYWELDEDAHHLTPKDDSRGFTPYIYLYKNLPLGSENPSERRSIIINPNGLIRLDYFEEDSGELYDKYITMMDYKSYGCTYNLENAQIDLGFYDFQAGQNRFGWTCEINQGSLGGRRKYELPWIQMNLDESNQVLPFDLGKFYVLETVEDQAMGRDKFNSFKLKESSFVPPYTDATNGQVLTIIYAGAYGSKTLAWKSIDALPSHTEADNGKVLTLVDNVPTWGDGLVKKSGDTMSGKLTISGVTGGDPSKANDGLFIATINNNANRTGVSTNGSIFAGDFDNTNSQFLGIRRKIGSSKIAGRYQIYADGLPAFLQVDYTNSATIKALFQYGWNPTDGTFNWGTVSDNTTTKHIAFQEDIDTLPSHSVMDDGKVLTLVNNAPAWISPTKSVYICTLTKEVKGNDGSVWNGTGITSDMLSEDWRGPSNAVHPSIGVDSYGRLMVYAPSGNNYTCQATVRLSSNLKKDLTKACAWGYDSYVQMLGSATRTFVVNSGSLLAGNGLRLSGGSFSEDGTVQIEFVISC